MSDSVDPFVREAVQAKVQQEIEANVYNRIKGDLRRLKFMGYSGGGVLAVLLFLGVTFYQPVFSFLVHKGGDEFKNTIKRSVEDHADNLRNSNTEARVRIEMAKVDLVRLTDKATEARDKVTQHIAEIEVQSKKLEGLIAQQKEIERSLALAQEATKIALSRYSEAALTRDTSENKAITPETLRRRSTVYFQFAGFPRDVALSISTSISDHGWQIPGQERTPAAANTNVIRYNPVDEALAKQLQTDANDSLKALNLPNTLGLEPHEKGIRIGILEIRISQ